ncbi:MAG: 16S rRNA (cytosine(1402)-N(4))-methyltransferase [Desulfobacterales bacterium]
MAYLDCKPGNVMSTVMVGVAGHSVAILEKIQPDGLLVGIDQDADAIQNAKQVLEAIRPSFD